MLPGRILLLVSGEEREENLTHSFAYLNPLRYGHLYAQLLELLRRRHCQLLVRVKKRHFDIQSEVERQRADNDVSKSSYFNM